LREHGGEGWAAAPDEARDPLVKALKKQLLNGTGQSVVRKEVATILGDLGPLSRSAVPQLVELLHEGVPDPVREAAVIALGKIGTEARAAVGHLVELLATARPALGAQAVRALGNIGCADGRVRSALVGLWTAALRLHAGRAEVAIALCKLRIASGDVLVAITAALVANQDACLRKAAAEALAWCGKNETDVVPALLAASLGDTNEEVRRTAQAGLDRMRLSPERAVQLCARQLGDSSHAEAALRKGGPLAVPALVEALGAEQAATRVRAARTLGCLGGVAADATPALTAALRDAEPDVRLAAAKALWNVASTAGLVVPALIDLLRGKGPAGPGAGDSRRRFLQTVMEALGRIGPPAAAAGPALIALTRDDNRHVRETALVTQRQVAPAGAAKPGPRR
jgi:HEAT repeat protein